MAKKEANFDIYIHGLLQEAGIAATAQGSEIYEANQALRTASKKQTGGVGYPEYTATVKDFFIIIGHYQL